LKVTIRNESGAYGFSCPTLYGQNAGSIQELIQGGEKISKILIKGKRDTKLLFTLLSDSQTSVQDTSLIKVFNNDSNMELPIKKGFSMFFEITPVGHDTTNLSIIY
jgi:hypothetical protein